LFGADDCLEGGGLVLLDPLLEHAHYLEKLHAGLELPLLATFVVLPGVGLEDLHVLYQNPL
jgi:hypothetical protein